MTQNTYIWMRGHKRYCEMHIRQTYKKNYDRYINNCLLDPQHNTTFLNYNLASNSTVATTLFSKQYPKYALVRLKMRKTIREKESYVLK